jgi:hypothetical protein
MRVPRVIHGSVWLLVALLAAGVERAGAQAPESDRKWEVGVHGGAFLTTNPTGGRLTLPGPGTPVPLATGGSSRRVSSWMFGAGAELLNEVVGSSNRFGLVQPLDPLLATSMIERGNGGAVGIRVARAVAPRIAAEMTVDYSPAGARFTRVAREGLLRTPETVYSALSVANRTATTDLLPIPQAHIREDTGGEWLTTAVAKVDMAPRRRATPFLTGGLGVATRRDSAPAAELSVRVTGEFGSGGRYALDETDRVIVQVAEPRHAFLGVVGAGVDVQPRVRVWRGRAENASRWGIRVDGRVIVSGSGVETRLSTQPSRVTATEALGPLAAQGAGVLVVDRPPGIQFTNDPALTGFDSTLSGSPVSDLRVFEGRGTRYRVLLTAGLFMRF